MEAFDFVLDPLSCAREASDSKLRRFGRNARLSWSFRRIGDLRSPCDSEEKAVSSEDPYSIGKMKESRELSEIIEHNEPHFENSIEHKQLSRIVNIYRYVVVSCATAGYKY